MKKIAGVILRSASDEESLDRLDPSLSLRMTALLVSAGRNDREAKKH
jgi:hypothetical protein